MPIGVLADCSATLVGCLIGSQIRKLPERMQTALPLAFGLCSMSIGICSIIKVENMTAVVLAVLIGMMIGVALKLEERVQKALSHVVSRISVNERTFDAQLYVTVMVLFCFSGLGWYGTLIESISGEPTILLSKAVLDFFTGVLFSVVLGKVILFIPFAQLFVLLILFFCGKFAAAAINDQMFADFSACGGILTLAAGLRVAKIKDIPLVDLLPALILVFVFSAIF